MRRGMGRCKRQCHRDQDTSFWPLLYLRNEVLSGLDEDPWRDRRQSSLKRPKSSSISISTSQNQLQNAYPTSVGTLWSPGAESGQLLPNSESCIRCLLFLLYVPILFCIPTQQRPQQKQALEKAVDLQTAYQQTCLLSSFHLLVQEATTCNTTCMRRTNSEFCITIGSRGDDTCHRAQSTCTRAASVYRPGSALLIE